MNSINTKSISDYIQLYTIPIKIILYYYLIIQDVNIDIGIIISNSRCLLLYLFCKGDLLDHFWGYSQIFV